MNDRVDQLNAYLTEHLLLTIITTSQQQQRNKTTTVRLISLPSIVSICWMLEMNGIIKHG